MLSEITVLITFYVVLGLRKEF